MKNYEKHKKEIIENKDGLEETKVNNLLKDLDYRNKLSEQFDKASPNKRRVMIAEDFLQQLKLSIYKPETGSFAELDIKRIDFISKAEKKSIQNMCDTGKLESCEVCEVGGVFMSAVRLNGDVKISDTNLSFRKIVGTLKKYYTMEQIVLMELAFEGGCGYFVIKNAKDKYDIETADEKYFYGTLKEPSKVGFYIKHVKKLDKVMIVDVNSNKVVYTATTEKEKEQIVNALRFYKKNAHADEINDIDMGDDDVRKVTVRRFKLIQMNIIKNKGKLVF